MSEQDKKAKAYRLALDSHLAQKFNTEIGQKAKVDRHTIDNELSSKANGKLRDIGEAINPVAGTLKYRGSCAVHIYESEMLGQIFFMSQTATMQDVQEHTASKALEDLKGSLMEFFGRKRTTKRSGF